MMRLLHRENIGHVADLSRPPRAQRLADAATGAEPAAVPGAAGRGPFTHAATVVERLIAFFGCA